MCSVTAGVRCGADAAVERDGAPGVSWARLAGHLGSLAQSATSATRVGDVVARLAEVARLCLGADAVQVCATDADSVLLTCAVAGDPSLHATEPLGAGDIALDVLRRRTVLARQPADGPACLSVPLMGRERCWGVVTLVRRRAAFTGEDIAGAVALADVGAALLVTASDRRAAATAQQQLGYQAVHDDLTGLPVRTVFIEQTQHALSRLERQPGLVAVLFMDLDGLKYANDTFGHPAGDALIRHVVRAVKQVVRPSDLVARVGGDEFVLLVEDIVGQGDVTALASRIIASLDRPVETDDGVLVRSSVSIGIALCETHEMSADTLVSHADAAMYRAKRQGGGRWEMFDEADYAAATLRDQRRAELHDALEHGQLELHYQPVIDLVSGEVHAVEALLRWHHPSLGLITAGQFLTALAAGSPLMHEISLWVVGAACTQLARWDAQLGPRSPQRVFVNVTITDLLDHAWNMHLRSCLAGSGLDPGRLVLEVTETELMADPGRIAGMLTGVTDLGCTLAIDDFGTGYSSLSRLANLSAAILKVDQSFTRDLHRSRESLAIISSILLLAHNLQMTVVVEGVEDLAAVEILEELGCTYAQGYALGHPEPASAISAALATRAADPTH